MIGEALRALGIVAGAQGDYERAEALHTQSLQCYQSVRYRLGIVEALEALAVVWEHQGKRRRAACLLTDRALPAAGARSRGGGGRYRRRLRAEQRHSPLVSHASLQVANA